jgi:hypothetical protein
MNDVRAELLPMLPPLWAVELGVDFPCDVPTVRKAFRRLARTAHPDVIGGSHEAFLHAQSVLANALAGLQSRGRASY